MRILFLGSGPFAIPALESLVQACRFGAGASDVSVPGASASPHEFLGVVTRPARPARRGRRLVPTPVGARASELGLPTWAPESVNDPSFVGSLRELQVDLAIVADYGQILRGPVLESAGIGFFNLHGSLLPRHRGAAPVAYAILAGDRETGVTLFRIERGLDSGPIVAAVSTEIAPDETAGALEDRLARLGGELLAEHLDRFADGSFRETPQDDGQVTVAPKIGKDEGRVNWALDADGIARRVRAYLPWPTAYSWLDRAGSAPERTAFLRALAAPLDPSLSGAETPGRVVAVERTSFSIACGEGALRVEALQREGRPAMSATDYLNGRGLTLSDRFRCEPEGVCR